MCACKAVGLPSGEFDLLNPFRGALNAARTKSIAMATIAGVAKPAMLIASAGLVLGAIGFAVYRVLRARGSRPEMLLPRVDVAAYNDALLAP